MTRCDSGRFRYNALLPAIGLLLCLLTHSTHAQTGSLQLIGEVVMTKGVVTARSDVRSLAALAKGSPIYLADIIETATRSFAVIKFNDGGKVTLRPESRFDLNEYDDTAGQEKESFALIKGGLRAVTGAIGKARPEDVTYTARNTTIGIRGTTLVIRLCVEGENGCNTKGGGRNQSEIEADKKFVDIFIVDKTGGSRKRITRQQLHDLLQGIYISVIDGAIRVSTADWIIDMEAGDKCLIDLADDGSTSAPDNPEVECFNNGPGLEDTDVFLGPDAEKISLFNTFDDGTGDAGNAANAGNELCEIN